MNYSFTHPMEEKTPDLRKILALNIKKQREKLGITQENLAEKAGISAAMMNDNVEKTLKKRGFLFGSV
jgi:DNA-binding XRE family transcriptional regulator